MASIRIVPIILENGWRYTISYDFT